MAKRKLYKFSKREIQHLSLSVLIMSLAVGIWQRNVFMGLIAIIALAPGFVFHELGHKFAAQKYGYFAEYRMWLQGLLLALLTAFLGFLIIAPGAVYFSGGGFHRSEEKIGKIGLAGPIINLLLVFGFGLLFYFSTFELLKFVGFFGAFVNSWLALFNLIPIPPFDGQKIFSWNKLIWGFTIGLAVAAFALVNSWQSILVS
jgi:Zn-dependent protease